MVRSVTCGNVAGGTEVPGTGAATATAKTGNEQAVAATADRRETGW